MPSPSTTTFLVLQPLGESCCVLLLKLVYEHFCLPAVFLLRSRLAACLEMRLLSSAPAGPSQPLLSSLSSSRLTALALSHCLLRLAVYTTDTLFPPTLNGLACVMLDTTGWVIPPLAPYSQHSPPLSCGRMIILPHV